MTSGWRIRKNNFFKILLLATIVFVGFAMQATRAEVAQSTDGDLKISMLNIGHGDALLIQTKEQTILIDTADSKKSRALLKELEKFSVTKIDKLILTHPHFDHIGNAKTLINPSDKELADNPYLKKISVAAVYDNGVASGSPLYKSYNNATVAKKIPCTALKAGDTLDFGGGVTFKVLFPTSEFVAKVNDLKTEQRKKQYKINNSSIVGRLTYKNFSMMFTGDCEKESEAKILAANNVADLQCDVLKSGHHGIRTSSTKNFVKAISPDCVLISAGNRKKHNVAVGPPYLEVLQNYLAEGVDKNHIYCTRWNGTITVVSDGKDFSVTPERKEVWLDKWMAQKQKEVKK